MDCNGATDMDHPRKNDQGKTVKLLKPSAPSPLAAWQDPQAVACVVPDGAMPEAVQGTPIRTWMAPGDPAAWEALAADMDFAEPDFVAPAGLKRAAGVVVYEPDGRVWLVAPSNQFGGYAATFPKGRLDGRSAKATALVEAFEECGLRVRLTCHLLDVPRSTTYTRYYRAERLDGNPADMGWESQAVLLVPLAQLPSVAQHANDAPIIAALKAVQG